MSNLSIVKSFLLILFTLFLYSCAKEQPAYLTPRQLDSLKVVLVWPADIYCELPSPIPFYCPVRNIIPGEISPSAKEVIGRLLRTSLEKFSDRHNFLFLDEGTAELLLEKVLEQKVQSPELAVKMIAESTQAGSILYLRVYRFKERVGRGIGVTEPASVAFALFLYDGKTGKLLWHEVFDETQKPLSENILNLSLYKSIKWLTAEELAKNGLEKILSRSPLAR
jgi:hypothetical protein